MSGSRMAVVSCESAEYFDPTGLETEVDARERCNRLHGDLRDEIGTLRKIPRPRNAHSKQLVKQLLHEFEKKLFMSGRCRAM